uniref:Uncharacterized protein n=1 Tax=Anguilla anguilla TaxID=7936 RepID=A0A0E9VFS9_ANGAN
MCPFRSFVQLDNVHSNEVWTRILSPTPGS